MTEVIRSVGRYQIVREIGRGGMARVFLARQTDLDRLVALKELSAFHASDPQFAQRFLRESRLAGSLSHPNIVTVHEYFEHDGTPFIAMEYVPRGSLRPYVGRLSLAQVVGVIEGMLAGLTHAETKRIVHRDLKPENVMVTDEGRVKIADFGIAKAGSDVGVTAAFMTATGTTVGTPAYMAPEQAMARDIGPWTDLYSLGVMAYEMLVGRLPFPETEAPMVLLMKHVNEPVPPPRTVNPDLDADLAHWIERLLVKDPADRVRDATEAWDELEETVIRIFGARWRREARLPAPTPAADTPRPLTPAPFQGAPDADADGADGAGAVESDEFQSFSWREPSGPAAPLGTPPPAPIAPAAPAAPPGAVTPPPAPAGPVSSPTPPARRAPAPEPGYETAAASAPSAPPPVDEPPLKVSDTVFPEAVPATPEAAAPAVFPDAEPAAAEAGADRAAPEIPEAQAPEAAVPQAPEAPAFRTFGKRRPSPPELPPEPSPEPVAEQAPQPPAPQPEEWGATALPNRVPPPGPTPRPEPSVVPAAARPAADDPAAGGRRARTGPLLLLGAGLLVLAVIGFLAAPSSKKTGHAAALSSSASTGALEIRFPSNWRRVGAAPEVPGLALADPVALGGSAVGATVQAGRSDATGPTLLPAAFLARLPGTPRPEAVKLGAVAAYRYTGLAPSAPAQQLTVYAVPTDAGVVTIACLGAAAVASPDCEAIATSLRLHNARALPLGPSTAYAQALSTPIAKLQSDAAGGQSALSGARTRAAQASAATALAAVYADAASALGKVGAGPAEKAAHAAIVRALTATARDVGALATAAKRGNAAAYNRASAAVSKDQQRVTATLDALRGLGYTLG